MARDGQLRRGGPRRIGTALGIMRICSPRHLLGPFLLCLCWPRGAEGAEAAARMETPISSRGTALPARPRRAKVMRREHHASLSADSAAVGVGQQERENTNWKVQDGGEEDVSFNGEVGEAGSEEVDPEDRGSTTPWLTYFHGQALPPIRQS
ncbi:unnamed protein product [Prorocentrum cordatum]|uniref:Uncharacterized protein n=1 Tax=Prorocentrum cordatum TaxID=2364126 RepID=A0ABN9R7K8_9DINO|nr:unnamed protein product [Polarella glacialis]